MQIVKIEALDNGAHINQSWSGGPIPDGYAVIPDGMQVSNFPFGNFDAEEIDGVITVTAWEPGEMPEGDEPQSQTVTEIERLRADVDYLLMMEGD